MRDLAGRVAFTAGTGSGIGPGTASARTSGMTVRQGLKKPWRCEELSSGPGGPSPSSMCWPAARRIGVNATESSALLSGSGSR